MYNATIGLVDVSVRPTTETLTIELREHFPNTVVAQDLRNYEIYTMPSQCRQFRRYIGIAGTDAHTCRKLLDEVAAARLVKSELESIIERLSLHNTRSDAIAECLYDLGFDPLLVDAQVAS